MRWRCRLHHQPHVYMAYMAYMVVEIKGIIVREGHVLRLGRCCSPFFLDSRCYANYRVLPCCQTKPGGGLEWLLVHACSIPLMPCLTLAMPVTGSSSRKLLCIPPSTLTLLHAYGNRYACGAAANIRSDTSSGSPWPARPSTFALMLYPNHALHPSLNQPCCPPKLCMLTSERRC